MPLKRLHTTGKLYMVNKGNYGIECFYETAATNLIVHAVCKRKKRLPIGLGFFLQGSLISVATEHGGLSDCLDYSGPDLQWRVAAILHKQ